MLEYRVWSIEYRWSACLEVGSALRADLVAPSSVPDLHDCLKAGRSLPWPPFAKARATTGQSLRSYQSPSADVIVITSHPRDSHSKGDRKPEDWPGHLFRVSGLGHQVPGSGVQVQAQVREIRPLSSAIDSVIFSGGGCQASSIQPSVVNSAIRHLSSIQPSSMHPLSDSAVGTSFSTQTQFCLELSHPLGI